MKLNVEADNAACGDAGSEDPQQRHAERVLRDTGQRAPLNDLVPAVAGLWAASRAATDTSAMASSGRARQ